MGNLEKKSWWDYIDEDLQQLLLQSEMLCKKMKANKDDFNDFSFLVFPAAKAYEGFLKTLFLKRGYISLNDYNGRRFRIGKALNPSLEASFREKESVYDRIRESCGGVELADKMWGTWKQCRNMLFHWFPQEKNIVTYDEARARIDLIIDTMDEAYGQCKHSDNDVAPTWTA